MRRRSSLLLCLPLVLGVVLAGCGESSPTSPSTLPSVPTLRYTQFLAFGDSLTLGIVKLSASVGEAQADHAYPYQLEKLLAARYPDEPVAVLNYGKAGEWAQDGARRLPTVLAAERPEVFLLMEGTNDVNALGTAGIRPAINALQSMVRMASAAGLPTLVATIPPERTSPSSGSLTSTVPAFNDALRVMAASEGATVVEVYEAISADLSLIGPDGVHLTAAGYERVAHCFLDAIVGRFEASGRSAGH